MREKVWIIHRVYNIGLQSLLGKPTARKVEAIVYTEEQADKLAAQLAEKIDPMFGLDIQEWEMDADRPEAGE